MIGTENENKQGFIPADMIQTNTATLKNKMRLLEKTQQLKEMMLESNVKPTGYNNFGKYHYFSLDDIVPFVVKACNELGLAVKFDFDNKWGKLHVFDEETGCCETWTTPLPETNSSKSGECCKEIQAIQTYSRRALYLQWLEIVETNIIDGGVEEKEIKSKVQQKPRQAPHQKPQPKPQKKTPKRDPYEAQPKQQPTLTQFKSKNVAVLKKEVEKRLQENHTLPTKENIKKVVDECIERETPQYKYVLKAFHIEEE